jgi:response regulator of citrate/malate metabolism
VILLGMPIVASQGIGVVGEIRARIPGVKIAIVAESSADESAQGCLRQGAQSLLVKPLTIESVRRKVDILLGRRTSLAIPVQLA